MAVPRKSLSGFLTQAKGALRAAMDTKQNVTLVIGNESADLDSLSSSLLYAYLRSMAPPANAFSAVYVPVANLAAADVQLRPEYLAVFRHANIEARQLITLDDLPALSEMQTRLVPEKTRWILVDHNQLQGQLGKGYAHRVAGVIDHHDEEGSVPEETADEPRIIEKAGSCTSLVANYLRPAWDQLCEDAADRAPWDAEVAKLSLASILIDTCNLGDANKSTEHDRQAVAYLEAKISSGFDRAGFYGEIDAAKKDLGAMRLQDILRKDYKQWDQQGHKKLGLGVSSVVQPIRFLQDKAGDEAAGGVGTGTGTAGQALLDAMEGFARERKLDLYSVMTTSTSAQGRFERELLVWALNEEAVGVAQGFARDAADELGLEAWHGGGGGGGDDDGSGNVAEGGGHGMGQWRKVWWQRQVQHSRKRVAPLLRQAMG